MATQLDALWNEFAAETEEHLDALERLLSDRRDAARTRDEIGALFRYFHSLKGTFLAMGFSNVEALAHRCEDILSLVRDGRKALNSDLADVLLRAVDRLKAMREEVIANRKDTKRAVDVERSLESHSEMAEAKPQSVGAPVAKALPLNDDPEMLAIYSELLDQRLADIAGALSSNEDDRAKATGTAGDLAYGAEMMGFAAFSEHLQTIADGSGVQRTDLIDLLASLREQVCIIEDITDQASGSVSLATALKLQLMPDYTRQLDEVGALLTRLEAGEASTMDIVVASHALWSVLVCLGLEHASHLALLIDERFQGVQPQDMTALPHFIDLARKTLALLRQHLPSDVDMQSATLMSSNWDATFHTLDISGLAGLPETQHLTPDILASLSSEQKTKVAEAIHDGLYTHQLLFDLETYPDVASDIIAWLSSSVDTITSRTVYLEGAPCFEFLIVSQHARDWIETQLASLDPSGYCLRRAMHSEATAADTYADSTDTATAPSTRVPLIRVQSDKIDELMAEVGEMRTALASFADLLHAGRIANVIEEGRRFGGRETKRDAAVQKQLDAMEADLRAFKTIEQRLASAHRRIWETGLQMRVVPVDGLLARLSRAARDLAQLLGKDIDVAIEGRETRIDKSIVDLLIDPLMHMVRNAVDHGLETSLERQAAGKAQRGRLFISASERGNSVDIVISDDGKGLDAAKIVEKAVSLGLLAPHQAKQLTDRDINALIFRPGFSTADSVTEISGRGVGMDVVAASLQRLGGAIEVETALGKGTKFILKLPVSAALLRALLVEVGGQVFALPERQVVAVLDLQTDTIDSIQGQQIVIYRGSPVPLHGLAAALGFEETESHTGTTQVAIVSAGTLTLALSVDKIFYFQDLFLKDLHPMLAAVPMIAGASVLGDGRPVLVLDPAGLIGLTQTGQAPSRAALKDE